jgi:hypothetical protein
LEWAISETKSKGPNNEVSLLAGSASQGFEPVDHPKVRRIRTTIDELRKFLEQDDMSELFSNFEGEHDYPLDLDNRDFWEGHLGL